MPTLTSRRVQDILREYKIGDHKSEPHLHHQNFAECGWQDFKGSMNLVKERSGANRNEWLLIADYVMYIHNPPSRLPSP